MDKIDEKLVNKGASLPLAGVLDQSRHHVLLAEKYAPILHRRGWTRGHTNMLLTAIAELESDRSAVLDARDESKANRFREQAAVTASKAFKADVVMAFDDLYFEQLIDAESHQRVRATGGRLGRSAPLISKYFTEIRSVVDKYDPQLRPYFNGKSPLALLDKIKDELDQAQVKQELDYAALPRETLKVYEAKGKALFLIEKLNRIGKRAFAGQAEIVALFNKDLILRARKARRSASGIEAMEEAVDVNTEEETA